MCRSSSLPFVVSDVRTVVSRASDDLLVVAPLVQATTVRRETVDDEDVDEDHGERPERVVVQVRELHQEVQAGDQDAHDAPEHVPGEDQEPGEDHDHADDENDPAPGLDVVRDRQLPARELLDVVLLRETHEPVEHVEHADDQDHDPGEHLPAEPIAFHGAIPPSVLCLPRSTMTERRPRVLTPGWVTATPDYSFPLAMSRTSISSRPSDSIRLMTACSAPRSGRSQRSTVMPCPVVSA